MTETCNYKIYGNNLCNQPIADKAQKKCIFHCRIKGNNEWSGGGLDAIKNYFENNNYDIVDYSNLKYYNLIFDAECFTDTKSLLFNNTTFKNCTFKGCTLKNALFEENCTFDNTNFIDCKFIGSISSFNDSKFSSRDTIFSGCNFLLRTNDKLKVTQVNFLNCEVKLIWGTLFKKCYIDAEIFDGNNLKIIGELFNSSLTIDVGKRGKVSYSPMLYLDNPTIIQFGGLEIQGTFNYRQSELFKNVSPMFLLTNIDFNRMLNVQFENANLENAYFEKSLIEKIRFNNCLFPKKGKYKLLLEDSQNNSLPVKNFNSLTILYAQLRKNFESRGDFIEAGHWYYREMDNRLNQHYWSIKDKNIFYKIVYQISLKRSYKRISDFGENYFKPIRLLIYTCILFAYFYFYTGFSVVVGSTIEYDFSSNISVKNIYDFLRAISFSLSAMAFQIGKIAKVTSIETLLFYIIQIIITATLVPLFLLAIRRKFKR